MHKKALLIVMSAIMLLSGPVPAAAAETADTAVPATEEVQTGISEQDDGTEELSLSGSEAQDADNTPEGGSNSEASESTETDAADPAPAEREGAEGRCGG